MIFPQAIDLKMARLEQYATQFDVDISRMWAAMPLVSFLQNLGDFPIGASTDLPEPGGPEDPTCRCLDSRVFSFTLSGVPSTNCRQILNRSWSLAWYGTTIGNDACTWMEIASASPCTSSPFTFTGVSAEMFTPVGIPTKKRISLFLRTASSTPGNPTSGLLTASYEADQSNWICDGVTVFSKYTTGTGPSVPVGFPDSIDVTGD